ncbi:anti-sigma factor family protein [Paenibacillus sp. strain BS8-2]
MTELMHRQLDDDLRESEMEVLLNHTRHCPDCAAMFERLTRLSAELTSLPKVTPSYSLVDAIMPELIRIDNETKLAASAAPVTPSTSPSSEEQTIVRRAQRTRRFPSWKSISGVVAAGIVVGFFLITYPPQMDSGNNDSASNHLLDVAADTRKMTANTEMGSASQFTNSAGGDQASETPVEIHGIAKEPFDVGDQFDGEIKESDPDALSLRVTGEESGTLESENEADGGSDFKSMPFGGITDQPLFPSPDGKFVASSGDYQVIVSMSDGTPLFTSERKNGQHGELNWSLDSQELTYEVSLEHGATEKYVIDMTTLKESKAQE